MKARERNVAIATIAWRYTAFAFIASSSNLAAQQAVIEIAPSAPLAFSIAAGTLVGFVAKYILDKNFIFFDDYTGHGREAAKVVLYGLFSVPTTLIFWGFEAGFWAIWHNDLAKYGGATIGFILGYVTKFLLDKHFTFRSVPPTRN
jgi:putative flippase GtrA